VNHVYTLLLIFQILYLCEMNIHPEHELFIRSIDEAKLRNFSLSKEELQIRKKMQVRAS